MESTKTRHKLGHGDNKVDVPKSSEDIVVLLSRITAAALNNEVEPEAAKLALNAVTRIVEVIQADTRMKAVAIATHRTIDKSSGFGFIALEKRVEPSIT